MVFLWFTRWYPCKSHGKELAAAPHGSVPFSQSAVPAAPRCAPGLAAAAADGSGFGAGKRLRFAGKTMGKPGKNKGVMKKNGKNGKTMGIIFYPLVN